MENILLYVVIGAIVLAVALGFNKKGTSTATKPGPKSVKGSEPKTNVAPTKASLQKLTKRQIDDTAAAQGIKLDGRETKAKMIDAFIKQSK